jgi:hypothetical protein
VARPLEKSHHDARRHARAGLRHQAERIVELWGNVERQVVERRGTSIPDYLDWQAKSTSFDRM